MDIYIKIHPRGYFQFLYFDKRISVLDSVMEILFSNGTSILTLFKEIELVGLNVDITSVGLVGGWLVEVWV